MNTKTSVVVALAVLATLGCEEKKPQPPLSSPKMANQPAPTPTPTPTPTPAPTSTPTPAPGANDATVAVQGVTLALPDGWKRNPPANAMRLAEAVVPGPANDPAKACLVVFSTAGGTVEDNIARWSGQVRDDKGQPVQAKAEAKTIAGLKVSTVEMTGTYAGMGDGTPQANWTLRGAIIETPAGLLFIKMTGPTPEMTAALPGFNVLVESLKKP